MNATSKQLNYIEILANDLRLERKQRNAEISQIAGRPINFIDELTKSEASMVIGQFKEWKEKGRPISEEEYPFDDEMELPCEPLED